MGRPNRYSDDFVVAVTGASARTKLQVGSDRRAIVNVIIDNGGSMTLGALDVVFGYDVRSKVMALMRNGWLEEKK